MKKIVIVGLLAIITVGGVIAGVVDRIDQKKRERKKKAEGKTIHRPFGIYEKYMKRPLDFVLSALALVFFSPVLLITAVLVRMKLGSPVLFSQQRPGRDEELFTIRKFRSMTSGRDDNGELLPDKERLTPFGDTLRRTSMDELPELFSILKGDMSVVGPRPLMPNYVPYYTERERHRHDVRPGLSGLAQTSGRNALTWDERFSLDLEYVNHITFVTDLKIVIKTIRKVVQKEDIIVRGTEGAVLDFDVERRMNPKIS